MARARCDGIGGLGITVTVPICYVISVALYEVDRSTLTYLSLKKISPGVSDIVEKVDLYSLE